LRTRREQRFGKLSATPQLIESRSLPSRVFVGTIQGRETAVNVAIDIPDEIGQVLAAQAGGVSRAVLEAVAAEAYRSGMITTAQVQQMLGLRSRWETGPSSGAPRPTTTTRWTTWNGILRPFVTPPGNDRRRGHLADLLSRSDR
jgi:hypothetical protein